MSGPFDARSVSVLRVGATAVLVADAVAAKLADLLEREIKAFRAEYPGRGVEPQWVVAARALVKARDAWTSDLGHSRDGGTEACASSSHDARQLLTTQEAAALLGVTARHVGRLRASRELAEVRVAPYLFERADVLALKEKRS